MNSNTDLTNFWISWHGTCSIRLCLKSQAKEVADLANEVMQSTNADFRNQLRHLGSTSGMRRSIYAVRLTSHARKISDGRWSVWLTVEQNGISRTLHGTAVVDENGDLHYYMD